ncbi:MAG TPA: pantetheine-phosphate adenylyltransferase [Longimicrobiales bacterium]|nr:pantetheine-phosphate adenylyltransferase [Longimicrobiales bacterium]
MTDRSRKATAIYPGSFDPITLGHEDIVRRMLTFCDQVIVAVAHKATQAKQGLFSIEERVDLIRQVFADEPQVEVASFTGLLVDFARERDVNLIVRGLRAVSDFEYEFQMALMNRDLHPTLETIFLAPDARYSYLSASLVREITSLGGDMSHFVSPAVQTALLEKLGRE